MFKTLKKLKKGFTLVELVVVIAIIAVLSGVSVAVYVGITDKAKESADNQLLHEINNLMQIHEVDEGKFSSSKKALAYIEQYGGIKASSIKSGRDGYKFYFNITKNRFELIDTKKEVNSDISSKTYLDAFNAQYQNNGKKGYTGYQTYKGSTTFTYKYFDSDNNVYSGNTVTENNELYYWIHVPFNYKEYKEYSILTFIHGTNDSLYVQSDESRSGCEILPLSNFSSSTSVALQMLGGVAKAGAGHQGVIRSNLLSDNSLNAIGAGAGDNCFIETLLNEIKQDESLDCFIVMVQLNDEIWWENRAQYTINVGGADKVVQQLDIHSSYKVGYGAKVDTKSYSGTYIASQLGPNVWFQLLDQLFDKLCSQYSINQDKQYIMGFSLGGLSTFDLISHYPNRFAAAVAVCAAGADPSSENIKNIDQTKVLCMHGASDGWVSSKMGQNFITELTNQYANHGQFISVSGYGHSDAFLGSKTHQYGFNFVKNFVFGSERV